MLPRQIERVMDREHGGTNNPPFDKVKGKGKTLSAARLNYSNSVLKNTYYSFTSLFTGRHACTIAIAMWGQGWGNGVTGQ